MALLRVVLQLFGETVFAPLVWLFAYLYQFPADVQFKRTTQRYLSVLSSTESYKTYLSTAKLLDAHLGMDDWRLRAPPSNLCNAEALVFDAQVALALAGSANPIAMENYLRGMLLRNAHGMTNPELYPYFTGTKACVEDYCNAICCLINVFGGSKSASAADVLHVRPCYQERRDPDGKVHVVNLTQITSVLANPKPMNLRATAPVSMAAEARDARTRHATPTTVQRRTTTEVSAVKSTSVPEKSSTPQNRMDGNKRHMSTPPPAPATVTVCGNNQRANFCVDPSPSAVPSDDETGVAPNISTPSSQEASAALLRCRTTPLPKAASHLTVSATSSDERRPVMARLSTKALASGESTAVGGTQRNGWRNDRGASASPSPGSESMDSSFVQNLVVWAKQHALQPSPVASGAGDATAVDGAIIVPFDLSPRQRLSVLKDVLRSYGRTALILSGGASMGTYHTGVIRALYEAGTLPDVISGSSAGSIISAIVCTKSPKQLKEFIEVEVLSTEILQMTPFGNDTSLAQKLKRLFKTGFLMDVRTLMECVRSQCGDMTFLEAYEISGRVLNITVTRDNQQGTHFDRHVLLNYLTAPHVVIWSAVSASSALPGLFTAVQLIEKSPDTGFFQPHLPGELYCDGSVAQDIPRDRIAQLFGVSYFIVSQVNPYVIPFLHPTSSATAEAKLRVTASTKSVALAANYQISLLGRLWYGWAALVCHVMLKCFYSGLLPKTGSFELPFLLLTQSYCGHVTILPIGDITSALPDYLNMASNPTAEYISYVATRAQVRTWPLVARIKSATCIERALLKEIALLERNIRKAEKTK